MRVTLRGYGTVLAGIVLLIGGLYFGYPELAVVGAAATGAFIAALSIGLRRWSLRVDRVVEPERVTRGEACRGIVRMEHKARWRGMDLHATDRCSYPVGVVPVPVPVLRLEPGVQSTVHYALPSDQRGVIEIGPLTIERRDLFDLVRVSKQYGGTRKVWVHPKVQLLRAIPAGTARSLDGVIDKVEHGNITFHALREYVRGDDLRQVHWRTSAKVGQLMVREHVDTSLPRMVVLLDDRQIAYPDPQDFEVAVEAAASVIIAALRGNLAVDLHLASGAYLSSGGASEGAQAFLDLLTEVRLHEETTGLFEVTRRMRQRRVGDTLIALTGPEGEKNLDAVAGLRDAFPSIVATVLGRSEPGTASEQGMLVIGASTVDDFARSWDGVRTW
ncbi:MAG: DUF58 domain-containing protein [Corynebacteriales bacterium]|nr:DUF58 domain-containing protein [Mycobacteriales bacterium]